LEKGFPNPNNETCYAASCLQLICAIPAFLETCKTEKGVIFDKLRKVCGDEKDTYNSFKDLCLKLNAPWPGQQDAYEFLNSLLMAVEDELQRSEKNLDYLKGKTLETYFVKVKEGFKPATKRETCDLILFLHVLR